MGMIEFHPLILVKVLTSGTNQPVLCRAANEDGVKRDIVVEVS